MVDSNTKNALIQIQKQEILDQLKKIREFVYNYGGCPDEDLLPLMPESQRRQRNNSSSSLSSLMSMENFIGLSPKSPPDPSWISRYNQTPFAPINIKTRREPFIPLITRHVSTSSITSLNLNLNLMVNKRNSAHSERGDISDICIYPSQPEMKHSSVSEVLMPSQIIIDIDPNEDISVDTKKQYSPFLKHTQQPTPLLINSVPNKIQLQTIHCDTPSYLFKPLLPSSSSAPQHLQNEYNLDFECMTNQLILRENTEIVINENISPNVFTDIFMKNAFSTKSRKKGRKYSSSHSRSHSNVSLTNSVTENAEPIDMKIDDDDLYADIIPLPISTTSNIIIEDDTNPHIARMSLRARLWSILLDFNFKLHRHKEYMKEIEKGQSKIYQSKIACDTQRTFLTSTEFNSRVSQIALERILNAFVKKNNKPYCQGMDAIAGSLLYVMCETDAFQLLNLLMNKHFPLYFYSDPLSIKNLGVKQKSNSNCRMNDGTFDDCMSDIEHPSTVVSSNSEFRPRTSKSLIGAYAGTYLAYEVLRIWDIELFNYLIDLHPYQYIFPLIASFQAISQPLSQVQRLWDFLFAYGVYLNPIVVVSQLVVNRKRILSKTIPVLLMGLLSQRKWMNERLKSKSVIEVSSAIANKICNNSEHQILWNQMKLHTKDLSVAVYIKDYYDMQLKVNGKFDIGRDSTSTDNGVSSLSEVGMDDESSDWLESDSCESDGSSEGMESDSDSDEYVSGNEDIE